MCQSTAYLKRDDAEEKLLEDVAFIKPEGDTIVLVSLLGDRREVQGSIVEIDLMAHRVLIAES